MTQIEIQKLSPDAVLPTRAHANDAGMDLYSHENVLLGPGKGQVVKTGIAMAISDGFFGMIADRSSMGKKGIKVAGGVVDSGYRGEIGVILWNMSQEEVQLKKGDRIAQMIIVPIATPAPIEVRVLTETKRGVGGFGSTGK